VYIIESVLSLYICIHIYISLFSRTQDVLKHSALVCVSGTSLSLSLSLYFSQFLSIFLFLSFSVCLSVCFFICETRTAGLIYARAHHAHTHTHAHTHYRTQTYTHTHTHSLSYTHHERRTCSGMKNDIVRASKVTIVTPGVKWSSKVE
jgi:ABC-type nickel/cobalt efflux system permease component RcnA